MILSLILLSQLRDWEVRNPSNPGEITETCLVDGVPTLKCLEVVFQNIITISGALFILSLFIMFLIGSFTYITSFGDPEKVKKAQGTFRYALFGLILFLSATALLKVIDFLFLGNNNKIFQFTIPGT